MTTRGIRAELREALNHFQNCAADLIRATNAHTTLKAELEFAEATAISAGTIEGKNAEERKAQLMLKFQGARQDALVAKQDLDSARIKLRDAEIHVDGLCALLNSLSAEANVRGTGVFE